MRILLTGGAGYIGSHASLALLDAGHQVTVIDNLSTGNKKLIPKNANFLKCDISNVKKINELLKKESFDVLMHFAGLIQVEESVLYPKKYFDNNTKKAKLFFDTCIKNDLRNIIFSSTAAAYGNPLNSENIKEESNLNPLNPYGK